MAWIELFTTDIGLLSLFTIGFILAMAIYILGYIKQHVAIDEKSGAGKQQVPGTH